MLTALSHLNAKVKNISGPPATVIFAQVAIKSAIYQSIAVH